MQAINFAQAAADAVAHHGVPELDAHGQPDAIFPAAVFAAVEHQIAVGIAAALAVQPPEHMIELERSGKLHRAPLRCTKNS